MKVERIDDIAALKLLKEYLNSIFVNDEIKAVHSEGKKKQK